MSQSSLSPFDAAAIVMVLAAAFGYVNHKYLGLPRTVGLMMLGVIAAGFVLAIDSVLPSSDFGPLVRGFLDRVDFPETLMNGLLSFLLFAGALHVDLEAMRSEKWHVLALSVAGVIISTLFIGVAARMTALLFGVDLPLTWCLVFGALISPTDPVAVLGVLKRSGLPSGLQAIVGGESLFNDGVGVVVFSIVLSAAIGAETFSWTSATELFLIEALGGAAIGAAVGWIAFTAMRTIDEYNVEVMITLAVVMGGYALAHVLHVSGPVAMAVAGLLIGNFGVQHAMSETTRDHLLKFWSLIDEILNSVLFLLMGLELVIVPVSAEMLIMAVLAVPIVLAARFVSVAVPLGALHRVFPLPRSALPILTWGALRGGISIALALTLPAGTAKNIILTSTFAVVLFSVFVQGSTLGRLAERYSAVPTPAH